MAILLPPDAGQLEDYVLANAPGYAASMRAADEVIERGEPGVPLADAIAELDLSRNLCLRGTSRDCSSI